MKVGVWGYNHSVWWDNQKKKKKGLVIDPYPYPCIFNRTPVANRSFNSKWYSHVLTFLDLILASWYFYSSFSELLYSIQVDESGQFYPVSPVLLMFSSLKVSEYPLTVTHAIFIKSILCSCHRSQPPLLCVFVLMHGKSVTTPSPFDSFCRSKTHWWVTAGVYFGRTPKLFGTVLNDWISASISNHCMGGAWLIETAAAAAAKAGRGACWGMWVWEAAVCVWL